MTNISQISLQEIFEKSHSDQQSLFKLLQIGRTKGLQNSINRRLIWPFLMGLNSSQLKQKSAYEWKKGVDKPSLQHQQFEKDALRSLTTLKTYQSATKFYIKKKQLAILSVLDSIFQKYQNLQYIQGFHQIISIFLILFDDNMGYYLAERGGFSYFSDLLTLQFQQVSQQASQLIYELVVFEDSDFKKILAYFQDKKVLTFILPWILTFFSHYCSSLQKIYRIWDYILCSGPQAVIYLSAAIILSAKKQITQKCQNFTEASIQQIFQSVNKMQLINIQQAIEIAILLEQKKQLQQLKSYNKLNKKSMLRLQNFYKINPIHKNFHHHCKKEVTKYKRMNTALKIGGVFLVLGAAFLIKNKGKINFIKQ